LPWTKPSSGDRREAREKRMEGDGRGRGVVGREEAEQVAEWLRAYSGGSVHVVRVDDGKIDDGGVVVPAA
jgi:hypothetical protein